MPSRCSRPATPAGGLSRRNAEAGLPRAIPRPCLRLPLLVREGNLTSARQFVVAVPTIWESDRDLTGFNYWTSSWRTVLQKGVNLSAEGRAAINASTVAMVLPLVRDTQGNPSTTPSRDGQDRPLGATPTNLGPMLYKQGLVLTQDLLESALGGGSRAVLPVVYRDDPAHGNGHYVMFVQLERLP